MKATDREARARLDRVIARHKNPPSDRMQQAIERVGTRLRANSEPRSFIAPAAANARKRRLGVTTLAAATLAALGLVFAAIFARHLGISSTDAQTAVMFVEGSLSIRSGSSLHRIGGPDRVRFNEILRADDGVQLVLTDGSRIEMRAESELSLERAGDGTRIHLAKGDIIVNAAKQGRGHLYVQTKDVMVAVAGTVFIVRAGDEGSRVAVIEGEVRVREGGKETALHEGQHVATSPRLESVALKDDIAWSRHADALMAMLQSAFAAALADRAVGRQPASSSPNAAMPTQREFEEAAIKPCDAGSLPAVPAGARGGGENSLLMTIGRLHAQCLTVATLIRTAYGYGPALLGLDGRGGAGRGMLLDTIYGLGVEDGLRVRGGPDWAHKDKYTIEAVAGSPADAQTMRGSMLRALLERRFQLKMHVAAEQIPAFALTIAKGGLKMKEGICTPADPSTPRPATFSSGDMVRHNLEAARRGETTSAPCGFAGSIDGPNWRFVGAGVGVPALGGILGVPVIDRTGISAATRFNYVLEFVHDENTNGPMGRGGIAPSTEPSDIPRAANIFTAVEEQLGLKLEQAKAPREFLVIDQVERPTPN